MPTLDESDVEVYKMVNKESNNDSVEKTIIVKRMDLMFDEKECQIINFSDLTAYKML